MLLGYARVSKSDDSQDTAAQVSALTSAGCKRVFEDRVADRWRAECDRSGRPENGGDQSVAAAAGLSQRQPEHGRVRPRRRALVHRPEWDLRPPRAEDG